jgi:hypothetical protein
LSLSLPSHAVWFEEGAAASDYSEEVDSQPYFANRVEGDRAHKM